ncbi:hypothetical protein LCGC14_1530320 [marine sediment metagenome]|uniref:Uncharacterized protein n=1 Tax=marine sediment metagenome TaxID=412755 RepID=A0A0F9JGU9_9ZZZZ
MTKTQLTHGMYADEARQLGIEVPDNVPDCARFRLIGFTDITADDVSSDDGDMIRIELAAQGQWEWLTYNFELDTENLKR